MRRSSVSISSNIGEGDQLDSDKSLIRHFRIEKGSFAELFTQSVIAFRIGYLDKLVLNFLKTNVRKFLEK